MKLYKIRFLSPDLTVHSRLDENCLINEKAKYENLRVDRVGIGPERTPKSWTPPTSQHIGLLCYHITSVRSSFPIPNYPDKCLPDSPPPMQ